MTSAEWAPHRQAATSDPDTSHQAAERAGPVALSHSEQILMAAEAKAGPVAMSYPAAVGGITKSEAVRMTGLTDVQVGRRLADLVRDRKLHRTGTTRINARGFAEAVHYLGPGPDPDPAPVEPSSGDAWTAAEVRTFAHDAKAQHAPSRQTMPDGRPNPYDRCAVCGFVRHPCDTYDLADLLIRALNGEWARP